MKKVKQWIRDWTGIQHWKREYSISGRIGKHYCPNCQSLLILKKKSQVVNSESEEARKFDFSTLDSYMIGNVKFIWDIYYCDKCNLETSIKDIRIYERKQKKLK